jgi:hypothetical protein
MGKMTVTGTIDKGMQEILKAQKLVCAKAAMAEIKRAGLNTESNIAKQIYNAILQCGGLET